MFTLLINLSCFIQKCFWLIEDDAKTESPNYQPQSSSSYVVTNERKLDSRLFHGVVNLGLRCKERL